MLSRVSSFDPNPSANLVSVERDVWVFRKPQVFPLWLFVFFSGTALKIKGEI
jgi:hypothetical protein